MKAENLRWRKERKNNEEKNPAKGICLQRRKMNEERRRKRKEGELTKALVGLEDWRLSYLLTFLSLFLLGIGEGFYFVFNEFSFSNFTLKTSSNDICPKTPSQLCKLIQVTWFIWLTRQGEWVSRKVEG